MPDGAVKSVKVAFDSLAKVDEVAVAFGGLRVYDSGMCLIPFGRVDPKLGLDVAGFSIVDYLVVDSAGFFWDGGGTEFYFY